jgi:prophage antirepressor-like protein
MSVKSVVPFSFEGSEVRVTEGPDGKPWYCAKDVCGILGYANSRKAIAEHCRSDYVALIRIRTNGGPQKLQFIADPNLYRLMCNSTLPTAAKFQDWFYNNLLTKLRSGAVVLQPDLNNFYRDKYIRLLEKRVAEEDAEIARLRSELRSLMNSLDDDDLPDIDKQIEEMTK